MARAPSRPRLPRAPTYAESRPLKPDELTRLGYSPRSGRRVAKSVKRVTKTTKTWSERRTVQAGKGGMTKEAYTKEVESGQRAYADAATAERQRQARQARELKQDFPGITRAERQAIYAGYRRGQDGGRPLTRREYELLRRATRRVDPDDDPTGKLKQAMGYPIAAFPFMRVA
jgi:hypothetical protein